MNQQPDPIVRVQERLGYRFSDASLLIQAVTHKSYANEARPGDEVSHNERLEFLGDAVLNLVVSRMLMAAHPDGSEGDLSRLRATLVNEQQLAQISVDLDLGELLLLGKGEERSGGRQKSSLLADMFEAVLGAIFLDGGLDAAIEATRVAFGPKVEAAEEDQAGFDPKSQLQILLQQRGQEPPGYVIVDQAGPDHRRWFTVSLRVGDTELARGQGGSKKDAEQAAAQRALDLLRTSEDPPETQGP